LLFSAATGIQNNVWKTTPEEWLTIEGEAVDIISSMGTGYCSYKVNGGSGVLTYRYTIEEEGFFCFDANMYAGNYFYVYVNGQYLYGDGMTLPQTFAVSQVRPGDVVEIKANCAGGENSSMNIHAALLDDEVFWSGYDILNQSTLDVTEFSSTRIEGNISCDRDGVLYTSIPNDGNWKAMVDGKEAEVITIGDAMVGLNLTKGSHDIVFTYENQSYTIGAWVTVFCILVFLGLIYLNDRQRYNEIFMNLYIKIKKK
jgi:hypothetical protein